MSSVKRCPACGGKDHETNWSSGEVTCKICYAVVETGLLVSEVGFSEGAGGRMHLQGTFVSQYSTGAAGFGNRSRAESSENVKRLGRERIKMVAEHMGLTDVVSRKAQRFFELAVTHRFNKGRRTDYVVASCLYLACRLGNGLNMLIDFSERLGVNVYELGATYLKMRSTLSITDPMPEVDPAIYNIRFARRLDFDTDIEASHIATDASRLVKRFAADWMTQGRRPAGICGACILVAARLAGYLRTPEEVAQVVKVSPYTIRRRLTEFARSEMGKKTVDEFKAMTDEELKIGTEEPPSVTARRRREEKERLERERMEQDARDVVEKTDEDEEVLSGKKRKRNKGKARQGRASSSSDDNIRRDHNPVRGETLADAIQGAAEEFGGFDVEGYGEDDPKLDELERAEYVKDLAAARDNAKEEAKKTKGLARDFRRQEVEEISKFGEEDYRPEVDDDAINNLASSYEGVAGAIDHYDGVYMDGHDKEEDVESFGRWDDEDAVHSYFAERFFAEDAELLNLKPAEVRQRVKNFIGARDAQSLYREMICVALARKRADRLFRQKETEFPDIDDAELEMEYEQSDDVKLWDAKMWLRENGQWYEEYKEKEAKKLAYEREHGVHPDKIKRKRKNTKPHPKRPFSSAQEAMESVAVAKKITTTRIDYSKLVETGNEDLAAFSDDSDHGHDGEGVLETMDDKEEKFDDAKDDEW